jgi:hypothetical protein
LAVDEESQREKRGEGERGKNDIHEERERERGISIKWIIGDSDKYVMDYCWYRKADVASFGKG